MATIKLEATSDDETHPIRIPRKYIQEHSGPKSLPTVISDEVKMDGIKVEPISESETDSRTSFCDEECTNPRSEGRAPALNNEGEPRNFTKIKEELNVTMGRHEVWLESSSQLSLEEEEESSAEDNCTELEDCFDSERNAEDVNVFRENENLRRMTGEATGIIHNESLRFRSLLITKVDEYSCEICNKRFKNLKNHSRCHTGEKPYKCEVCSKCFTLNSTLWTHSRIHFKEKPYSCDLCNKKFAQKIQLKNHHRVHTGERPYNCNICSKKCSTSWELKCHVRTHTGERPYECKICHKLFSYRCALSVHFRFHTGEKPYKCDLCHKEFAQQVSLKRHYRVHLHSSWYNKEISVDRC